LPNWLETIVVYLATVRIGAIANPIIPIYREREVGFILREAGSKVFVVPSIYRDRNYLDSISQLTAPALRHVIACGGPVPPASEGPARHSFEALLDKNAGAAPRIASKPDDVVLLLYTSGTVANPKGVKHSHRTLAAEAGAMIGIDELSPQDVIFLASPLGHISGIDFGIYVPFMLGTRVCLLDRWAPVDAARMIHDEGCTWTGGATPFLQGLLNDPEARDIDIASLRTFRCGGAEVPPALIREARAHGIAAYRAYGSSEHPTVSGGRSGDPVRAATTDGKVHAHVRIRIVDIDDPTKDNPSGVPGEILTQGPELFLGYHDASLNADTFKDGWYRTGDIGALDADGYLTITGRRKDIIIRKGENISAKEVENVLAEHPVVYQASVIGLPDVARGERVCAVIVTKPGTTIDLPGLTAWLKTQGIARQKIPEQLEVVDALPMTPTGKIKKNELRTRFSDARV
jgi:cyclohexanecarboxylate-CoA ligase